MNRRNSKGQSNKSGPTAETASVKIRPENRSAFSAHDWLALLGLAIVVFAVYMHSGRFGFLYDDHKLILRQGRADSLDDFARVFTERHWENLPYYRPVSRLTMVAQKWLHGDNAGPFHLFNTALMSLCAVVASRLPGQKPFRIPVVLTILGRSASESLRSRRAGAAR